MTLGQGVTYADLLGTRAHIGARTYSESEPEDIFAFLAARPAWMADAACKGMDTAMWYPSRGGIRGDHAAQARAICATCPVREDCLLYATTPPLEHHGIWGGLSERQRRFIHRDRVA